MASIEQTTRFLREPRTPGVLMEEKTQDVNTADFEVVQQTIRSGRKLLSSAPVLAASLSIVVGTAAFLAIATRAAHTAAPSQTHVVAETKSPSGTAVDAPASAKDNASQLQPPRKAREKRARPATGERARHPKNEPRAERVGARLAVSSARHRAKTSRTF